VTGWRLTIAARCAQAAPGSADIKYLGKDAGLDAAMFVRTRLAYQRRITSRVFSKKKKKKKKGRDALPRHISVASSPWFVHLRHTFFLPSRARHHTSGIGGERRSRHARRCTACVLCLRKQHRLRRAVTQHQTCYRRRVAYPAYRAAHALSLLPSAHQNDGALSTSAARHRARGIAFPPSGRMARMVNDDQVIVCLFHRWQNSGGTSMLYAFQQRHRGKRWRISK